MTTEAPAQSNAEQPAAQPQQETQSQAQTQQTAVEQQSGAQPPAEEQQAKAQEFELSLPEGSLIDQETFTEFAKFVKDSGVTQEQAKALSDLGDKMLAKQQEQQDAQRHAWAESAKADKEFGGEHFDENAAVARKAIDFFGTTELKQALNESGLGNHPELIRAFYRIGKAIGEDKVYTGGNQPPAQMQSVAQRMYPDMNP